MRAPAAAIAVKATPKGTAPSRDQSTPIGGVDWPCVLRPQQSSLWSSARSPHEWNEPSASAA